MYSPQLHDVATLWGRVRTRPLGPDSGNTRNSAGAGGEVELLRARLRDVHLLHDRREQPSRAGKRQHGGDVAVVRALAPPLVVVAGREGHAPPRSLSA